MAREHLFYGNERWTTHPRRIPQDSLHQGRPLIENGCFNLIITPDERISTREDGDAVAVSIDLTGGEGRNIVVHHLFPEATGWNLTVAKILDRFDQTRLGKWWNGTPE